MKTDSIEAPPLTLGGRPIDDFAGIWRVVCVKSREEKAFAWECDARGLGYFLPMQRVRRKCEDKPYIIHEALLPGFAFVCTENDDQFFGVRKCRGFRFVLNETLHPDPHSALSIAVQRQLRRDLHWHYVACMSNANIIEIPVEVGSVCRIKSGPFMGYEGPVTRYNDKLQLVLDIEFMCRRLPYEIDAADVEVIEPPAPRAGAK